ncbi:adenylate cyclase [Sphingopyxis sp. XHP0097]|uniref:Adenylate cyclase n=1 Tax=Sphingopyxis jiangsuensis TaxID=2871171 RepID=A0ABS7MGZ5_9SPHN|nr:MULTISPECIES: adenylate cyclase [Sphingopyxis]MBL0768878.1 adenylate cyclase [Sphingopyxis lutea]MBY4638016.1 adenylate cyclase [Sphingopyxis jiangsuensis]
MATTTSDAAITESFWERMALGLALLILFGFAQFALRGFVDPFGVPLSTHFHGLAMLAWLALLVVQPRLVRQGDMAMHRRLGRLGVALSMLVVGLGFYVGISVIAAGRLPPFFTPHYFLVLVSVELLAFGGLVWAAVAHRSRTDWHRRFMIGSAIMLLEPALGRLLPMPLMIGWWDLPIAIIQLAAVGLIALHDRRTFGHVHSATKIVALLVILVRLTIYMVPMLPPVQALAAGLSGG